MTTRPEIPLIPPFPKGEVAPVSAHPFHASRVAPGAVKN
jgi:hypothetical protein